MTIRVQKSLAWTIAFLILGTTILLAFLIWLNSQTAFAQSTSSGRKLWDGDAHVKGAFGARTFAATDAIQSGSDIIAASRVIAATLEMAGKQFNSVNPASGDVMKYDSDTGTFRNKPDLSGSGGGSGSTTLAGLTDVNTAGAALGNILTFSAGNIWAASMPVPASHTLDDGHSNVSTGAKNAKDLLFWDGLVWSATPQNLVPHSHMIDQLNDVSVSGKSDGQYLGWDGASTLWKNKTLPASSGTGGGAYPPIIIAASTSISKASANYICTGVSDELTINAAMAIAGGTQTIQLLEGVFYLAGPIQMTTNGLRLRGAGQYATILKRQYNETLADSNLEGGLIVFNGAGTTSKIEISDLGLDGAKSVWTYNSNNGFGTKSNVTGLNLSYSKFENIYILNCGGNGFRYRGAGGNSNYNIISNMVIDGCSSGFYIKNMGYAKIDNCKVFSSTGTGMGFYFYTCNQIKITNCTSYQNAQNGFYLDTCAHSQFLGNLAYDDTQNSFYLNACDYSQFVGNDSYSCGASYYGLHLQSTNCTITGNNFYNHAGSGIYNYISNDNQIVGNNFSVIAKYAIYTDTSARLNISGNIIDNCGGTDVCIYLKATDFSVCSNNTIYNSPRGVISVYNGSDSNLVDANNIYLYGVTLVGIGIQVAGGNQNKVSNNHLYSGAAGNYGITNDKYSTTNSYQTMVSGNTFWGSYVASGQVKNNCAAGYEILYANQPINMNTGTGSVIVSASTGVKVGIGTTAPAAAMDIKGTSEGDLIELLRLNNAATTTTNAGARIGFQLGTGVLTAAIDALRTDVGSGGNTDIIFNTYNSSTGLLSERMRIMSNNAVSTCKIGMATITPSVALEIHGTAYSDGGWTSPSLISAKKEINLATAGLMNSALQALENLDIYSWKWKADDPPTWESSKAATHLESATVLIDGITETVIQIEKIDRTREQVFAAQLADWKKTQENPRQIQRVIGPILDFMANPALEPFRAYDDDGKLKGKNDSQAISFLIGALSENLKRDKIRDQRISDLEKRISDLEAKFPKN